MTDLSPEMIKGISTDVIEAGRIRVLSLTVHKMFFSAQYFPMRYLVITLLLFAPILIFGEDKERLQALNNTKR